MAKDALSITDHRTGKSYEVPIKDGTINAMDLRQIKTGADDFGLMSYDLGYTNTANCRSAITFIDGDQGILNYRGYPIADLAEHCDFLEVAKLLIDGALPNQRELDAFRHDVTIHTFVHENIKKFIDGFRYDAHPMGMLLSTVGALSTFYPEAKNIGDQAVRRLQMTRLIAKMPTLAAFCYRHAKGRPLVYPENGLGYAENFLYMIRKIASGDFQVHPTLAKALNVLFILHADHEQNCSTTSMRTVGSSQADPYSATSAAIAALYGPLHGGANEEVLRMLREIRTPNRIPEFIKRAKDKSDPFRLMGFGHRVYKNYDPRAKIIRALSQEVFELTGTNPLLDIAIELERIALQDEYFIERKLYPNVDFYSGIIYEAMGFESDFFTVLFAIPRTVGWLCHWEESLQEEGRRIARPRQIYCGPAVRPFVPLTARK